MNDRPHITVRPRRRQQAPRLTRAARPARVRLTDRDRAIFMALAVHRLLTAEQIGSLIFPRTKPRRVRRRLRLLYDAGLLERVAVVAQPTRGVPPYVYQLTDESADIAAADLGRPVRLPSARNRSLRFLAHHVGVCRCFVTLNEALRATPWSIGEWRHEWQLKLPHAADVRRAERVRLTDPDTHEERELTVLPDAFFTLVGPTATRYFFLELDCATHSLARWRDRALAFSAYDRQGLFTQRFTSVQNASFCVLIVTTRDWRGRSRCDNILNTIQQAIGARSHLFLAATVADVTPDRLLTPVWRRPGSPTRHYLCDSVTVPVTVAAPFAVRTRPLAIVRPSA